MASPQSDSSTCNAGIDAIFGAFGVGKRCGKPAKRVCVTGFTGDPGLIESYCPAHIKDLERDGYRAKPY